MCVSEKLSAMRVFMFDPARSCVSRREFRCLPGFSPVESLALENENQNCGLRTDGVSSWHDPPLTHMRNWHGNETEMISLMETCSPRNEFFQREIIGLLPNGLGQGRQAQLRPSQIRCLSARESLARSAPDFRETFISVVCFDDMFRGLTAGRVTAFVPGRDTTISGSDQGYWRREITVFHDNKVVRLLLLCVPLLVFGCGKKTE